ncbi:MULTISPECIES: YIP1 family protein [unclassified Vibrio]|uniref:YIP1 family protein n=1 Tax=Vibrio sp. HB236076 TaxID=3232307 RepID=A0AB39HHP8_9VIBR|nr:YIP1 family protein [Vibrio sp. HB161653]MDP5254838.1 YIP1 family protein [Vibrio sp. HB161653]
MTTTHQIKPWHVILHGFTSPQQAFITLYHQPKAGWFAYLALVLSVFLFWGAYFERTDPQWLLAQLSQIYPTQSLPDPQTLLAGQIISDVLSRTLCIVLLAIWFHLATKHIVKLTLRQWFAAASVMMLPALLGDMASYVSGILQHEPIVIFSADLNSLNGLLHLEPTSKWSQIASAFPLLMPWYIVLGYGAVLTWTPLEGGQALAIAMLPWLGFFSFWSLGVAIS